ncbi:indolepyruvate ferredoxin oxidoreductase subunit alpha [Desulfonema ishimotonii]|uniref:Indolepyruvate oxidoreductase subunit IorA n=1 Tax=Desulfonema ishimotonii TaxID=45657 RepID=A0A401G1J3_9BACT|nr:indolepyruvate ferredoxin oxidoreductase subunit alpha [Desulfonema ishimotonii]GBC63090.1 indolepyruvate ferredoxin oxidoreductase subunit alpha [Desulfonema ishimotonii]
MHKLLTDQPGQQMLLLGNEAITRGAVEAGVAFASTYPGTPSSEISLNLFQISRETDLYFEYSTNEKVALEVAAAAAVSGVRSMCMMKHVGVNVAADVLMTLAYIGVKGGLVILTADDPYMFSSQNEQDNRYYAKLSGLPMLEPSSVEEARSMMPYAFDLSEKLGEPVLFRTTTRVNHSTAAVTLGEMRPRQPRGDFVKDPFNFVCVPAVSRKLHVRLLENMEKAEKIAGTSEYNFTEGAGNQGIICNGVSYNYVSDAVTELGIADNTKILRIGFSHPLPQALIKDFLGGCEKVLVVEEGEPYMEEAVKAFAQEAGLTLPIRGKSADLFSRLYEFDPATVKKNIAAFFDVPYTPPVIPDLSDLPEIPQRPPTLCAGCSHRATFYAVKKAAEGMDVMHPSDIGCYTLGFLPPLSMADFVVCMGASAGTSGGFSKVTDKKVISFIGDSTFFHSGISGLINAVFNNHKFTLVILDNGTTAMTGHQPNPGVDMTKLNMDGFGRISIEAVVRAIGVRHVSVIRPYKVQKSIAAIKEALDYDGVSVVISQEPCSLYAKSLKELKPRAFYVTDRCKNHRTCLDELGCPAFYLKDDRVCIDPDLCIGCTVCVQICPENAIRPVKKTEG